ncbi:MAG: FliA/WhiG family RNA polymerase sigma factor [Candidatus Ruminococcus intestinipullorum]|nr:FliA/WhiG family RNA polymerase sigma factor [Candidatus Ruminococcus intestinipullorum]
MSQREASLTEKIEQYRKTLDEELRNEILMDALPIVQRVAALLRGIMRSTLEEEDLIHQGVLSLMECMDRYDISKGAKFETYAFIRIRGALIDYVRKQDWIPHQTRSLHKQIEQASAVLMEQNHEEPDEEAIAQYLNLPVEKIYQNQAVMHRSTLLSFENVLQDFSDKSLYMEPESKDDSLSPEASMFQKEIRQVLAKAIDGLTEKERLVVALYYYEELKYSQIAEVMEIGESRVSQLHAKAIRKLKQELEEYRKG